MVDWFYGVNPLSCLILIEYAIWNRYNSIWVFPQLNMVCRWEKEQKKRTPAATASEAIRRKTRRHNVISDLPSGRRNWTARCVEEKKRSISEYYIHLISFPICIFLMFHCCTATPDVKWKFVLFGFSSASMYLCVSHLTKILRWNCFSANCWILFLFGLSFYSSLSVQLHALYSMHFVLLEVIYGRQKQKRCENDLRINWNWKHYQNMNVWRCRSLKVMVRGSRDDKGAHDKLTTFIYYP